MARKHLKQMNKEEIAFVHGFVRANAHRIWTGTGHFYDRASDRKVSIDEVQIAAKIGRVIELHDERKPDIRVMVRSKAGICAVISLLTWEAITCYYNAADDEHDTLNWNLYRASATLDVVKIIKSLRRK